MSTRTVSEYGSNGIVAHSLVEPGPLAALRGACRVETRQHHHHDGAVHARLLFAVRGLYGERAGRDTAIRVPGRNAVHHRPDAVQLHRKLGFRVQTEAAGIFAAETARAEDIQRPAVHFAVDHLSEKHSDALDFLRDVELHNERLSAERGLLRDHVRRRRRFAEHCGRDSRWVSSGRREDKRKTAIQRGERPNAGKQPVNGERRRSVNCARYQNVAL